MSRGDGKPKSPRKGRAQSGTVSTILYTTSTSQNGLGSTRGSRVEIGGPPIFPSETGRRAGGQDTRAACAPHGSAPRDIRYAGIRGKTDSGINHHDTKGRQEEVSKKGTENAHENALVARFRPLWLPCFLVPSWFILCSALGALAALREIPLSRLLTFPPSRFPAFPPSRLPAFPISRFSAFLPFPIFPLFSGDTGGVHPVRTPKRPRVAVPAVLSPSEPPNRELGVTFCDAPATPPRDTPAPGRGRPSATSTTSPF